MTTRIIVHAHCTEDKEVQVTLLSNMEVATYTVQSGEVKEFCAYDSRTFIIKEVLKDG